MNMTFNAIIEGNQRRETLIIKYLNEVLPKLNDINKTEILIKGIHNGKLYKTSDVLSFIFNVEVISMNGALLKKQALQNKNKHLKQEMGNNLVSDRKLSSIENNILQVIDST